MMDCNVVIRPNIGCGEGAEKERKKERKRAFVWSVRARHPGTNTSTYTIRSGQFFFWFFQQQHSDVCWTNTVASCHRHQRTVGIVAHTGIAVP
jgi:hypothetical protein